MFRAVLLAWVFPIAFLLLLPAQSFALTVRANEPVELSLVSARPYGHPHRDVTVLCEVRGPDDETFSVRGYWDGGSRYKIRFSLPDPGEWSCRIIASDTTNPGLHGIEGTIQVLPAANDHDFSRHGPLRISDDRRHLSHADGTPFFYLGDTAWEMTWKSDSSAFLEYLDDRASKGFTAIQLVALTHQSFNYRTNGVTNRAGVTSFLSGDYSMPNPRYFDYLDFIVSEANERGIVVAIVPLWALSMELYPSEAQYTLTVEEGKTLGTYLGARYAGSQVIWIIGGDNEYDTEERKSFWTEFANLIRDATGNRQLLTLHPRGWSASFDYFDNETEWLDFHMYQSSHRARADFTWMAGSRGYGLKPTMPVLNGEANYEDIFHNLWQPGDTSQLMTFRIEPVHIRQASYESVLSGAVVGITYGGNGIWQWHTEELPGTHLPRFEALDAIHFDGSSHVGVLKDVLTRERWHELEPRPDLVLDFDSEENYLPILASDSRRLVYVPRRTRAFTLGSEGTTATWIYEWVNPRSGVRTERRFTPGFQSFTPPDTNDWVLVAERDESGLGSLAGGFRIQPATPNPFQAGTRIRLELGRKAAVAFDVFDLRGRRIRSESRGVLPVGVHDLEWDGRDESGNQVGSGIYWMRTRVDSEIRTRKVVRI